MFYILKYCYSCLIHELYIVIHVIHIMNLKQELNLRLVLKKGHKFNKLNEKA